MKAVYLNLSITAFALFIAAGCGKSEAGTDSGSPDASNAPSALATAAADAKRAATQAVADAKDAAAKVVSEASTHLDAAKAQAQTLIDKTKTYVAEKNYTNALTSLKQLSDLKLTPDQQKMVDDIKSQIQQLVTGQSVSNVIGNFLKH